MMALLPPQGNFFVNLKSNSALLSKKTKYLLPSQGKSFLSASSLIQPSHEMQATIQKKVSMPLMPKKAKLLLPPRGNLLCPPLRCKNTWFWRVL